MPPTINGMRRPIEKIYTKLTKQTARGGRSLRPGQRVFDDIVQLAGLQAQLGMEQLLTDDAVDEHDFHLLMVCYITERVDNKWELL